MNTRSKIKASLLIATALSIGIATAAEEPSWVDGGHRGFDGSAQRRQYAGMLLHRQTQQIRT